MGKVFLKSDQLPDWTEKVRPSQAQYNIGDTKLQIGMAIGVFDTLHPGHLSFLAQAKLCVTTLLVVVYDDESAKRLNGYSRPLMPLEARVQILISLPYVDAVIVCNSQDVTEIIDQVKPNYLFKGNEKLTTEKIVGAKEVMSHGGFVCKIPYNQEWSTSNIINNFIHKVRLL